MTFGMYEVTLTSEQPGNDYITRKLTLTKTVTFALCTILCWTTPSHSLVLHHRTIVRLPQWPSTTTFTGLREENPKGQHPFSRCVLIWWRLRAIQATRESLSCASEQGKLCTVHLCIWAKIVWNDDCYIFTTKLSSWSTDQTRHCTLLNCTVLQLSVFTV